MHALNERYAPLGEETRLSAMTDIFNFDRTPNETIDNLLTRFDITRNRAANDGGIGINIKGLTLFLLRACRVTDSQLLQLLIPFQGRYPNNDAEFTQLCAALRRMGHILEKQSGNIASALRSGGGDRIHGMFFGNEVMQQGSNNNWRQENTQADPMWADATDPWQQ